MTSPIPIPRCTFHRGKPTRTEVYATAAYVGRACNAGRGPYVGMGARMSACEPQASGVGRGRKCFILCPPGPPRSQRPCSYRCRCPADLGGKAYTLPDRLYNAHASIYIAPLDPGMSRLCDQYDRSHPDDPSTHPTTPTPTRHAPHTPKLRPAIMPSRLLPKQRALRRRDVHLRRRLVRRRVPSP